MPLNLAPSCSSLRPDLLDHRELLLVGHSKRISGVLTTAAMRSRQSASVASPRARIEQADRDVKSVIVTVEAVAIEDVPGHLARERRAHLRHPGLDQGVPGLPHDRPAAKAISSYSVWLALTSAMIGAPGWRSSTSAANLQ